MATMHTARPQAEVDAGFGLLKDIINIIKDPEGFDAAHAHAREQAALTEDYRNKLNEAQQTIKQADDLKHTHDRSMAIVKGSQDQLAKNQLDQAQYFKGEEIRLRNLAEELRIREENLAIMIREQKNECLRLDSERETNKANHDQKMALLNAREAELGRQADENTRVANELSTEKKRQEDRDRELVRLATGK